MAISRGRFLQLSIIAIAAAGCQMYINFLGLKHCYSMLPFYKQVIFGITVFCGLYDLLAWIAGTILKLVYPKFFNNYEIIKKP